MRDLSREELKMIQGGESYWVKCTRGFGFIAGNIVDAIEWIGNNASTAGCKL